jgi:predicted GNAT family acetyltransferase
MAAGDGFGLQVYDDELRRYVDVPDPLAKPLAVRKQSAKEVQKRRFAAKQAERRRANKAAMANVDELGSGIASIPGRVVNYIKSSSPSSVARDVKGIAKSTIDAAVENPNAFIEDAIFSPLAAIRDFGDVRETARKLRAQGRDAEAEKMEAMAGTAVLSAVPILGRPAGVATRKAIKAAEKSAIKGATKATFDLGSKGYKSAKVGDTNIEYAVGPSGVEVSKVFTPSEARGRGSARAAMQALVEAADREGLQLNLTPDPLDAATSKTKLQGFYSSLGFTPNKGRNKDFATRAAMLRTPQQPRDIKAAEMAVTPKPKSKSPSLLSAVRVGGKTYTGPTHLDALDAIPDPKVRSQASLDANSRGFVNERGKYMDRFKAADYARNFDLFSPDAPDWAKTAPEVISENLKLPEMPSRSSLSVKPSSSPRFAPASQEPVVSQAGRMGVPVIGREQMAVQHPSKFGPYATIKPRRPESEVEITREPSVNMAPSEVFDVEKLQNSLIVPLYGDKSIAGERITSINDVPVSVETYGGPRYGALNAAVGSPSGWASELPQISALRNQIRGGLEQGRDVYGVYTAMSPRAADQTTMMADALLQQAQQAPIRKADVKAFDEAARQIVPNFAGIMHPEAYQQLLGAKQGQRKSLVELMDTAKALEAGLPDVSATRMALTTPELMYAPGGSTGFQVVKFGPESLEPVDVSLVHPTYGTQMAGTPVGHFEQQIPFDMLYPDLIKERRALGLSPGKDLRSFEFRKPTQVVDQETLDLVMKYLQDTQGAE